MLSWWRHRSLRARLTVVATASLALGLTLGTVGLALVFAHGRTADLDQQIRTETATVRGLVDTGQLTQPLPVPPGSPVLAQVVDSAGTVLTSSATAGRVLPLVPLEDIDGLSGSGPTTLSNTGFGSEPLRVDVEAAQLEGHPVHVVAAASMRDVNSTLQALRRVLLVVVPLTVLAAAIAAWLAIGSALRPVDDLRSAADRIGAGARRDVASERLPEPDTGDELARLARTLNRMLARLDDAAAQQRDFAADAAHELRTPLAALITDLEVAGAADDAQAWTEIGPAALADARRLAAIVDDLLLLARTDAGQPLRRERVDLAAVALSFAAPATPAAVTVPAGPVTVVGDQAAIERAVRNLVDNARRHAASSVTVTVSDADGRATVAVTDDGPGIPADQLPRVFDRFYRGDPGRGRSAEEDPAATTGTGLGLAIVRGVARAHGGDVSLTSSQAGGTTATLWLPTLDSQPTEPTFASG